MPFKPIVITIILEYHSKKVPVEALIDSGASDVFIDANFARKHSLAVIEVENPSRLELFDGQPSSAGLVCYKVPQASLQLTGAATPFDLFLTKIRQYQMVLGMTWLAKINPEINFQDRTIKIKTTTVAQHQTIQTRRLKISKRSSLKDIKVGASANLLPLEYHDFIDVFDEGQGTALPRHGPHDCTIELRDPEAKLPKAKMFRLTERERTELKRYLDDNLEKGFIRESTPATGAPIFFVTKTDGTLRPVVDYRELNKLTKENEAPLPIIADLFLALRGA